MKILPAFLFAAAIMKSSSAFGCSYAVREHSVLASRAPIAIGEGVSSVRIAISEVLLPARFAKTQTIFARTWLGLRGQRFDAGTGAFSSDSFEVAGNIDVICFCPGDAYDVLSDGRLVVWISGKLEASNPERLVLSTAVTEAENVGSVWRNVRWSKKEDTESPPLPSHPQTGMIQP